jgi:hypothetical protein
MVPVCWLHPAPGVCCAECQRVTCPYAGRYSLAFPDLRLSPAVLCSFAVLYLSIGWQRAPGVSGAECQCVAHGAHQWGHGHCQLCGQRLL